LKNPADKAFTVGFFYPVEIFFKKTFRLSVFAPWDNGV
jgi:hypothetical protein